jgi:hypothetical protein
MDDRLVCYAVRKINVYKAPYQAFRYVATKRKDVKKLPRYVLTAFNPKVWVQDSGWYWKRAGAAGPARAFKQDAVADAEKAGRYLPLVSQGSIVRENPFVLTVLEAASKYTGEQQ